MAEEISSFVSMIMPAYIDNMYCKSVQGINTFRNHNTKVETKLRELGFIEFSLKD